MDIAFKIETKFSPKISDAVVVFGKSGRTVCLSGLLPDALKQLVHKLIKEQPQMLDGKKNNCLIFSDGKVDIKLLLVGIGDEKAFDTDKARMLGGDMARLCRMHGMKQPYILCPEKIEKKVDIIKSIAEGVILGSYVFDEYKSKKEENILSSYVIVSANQAALRSAVKEAQVIGESVNFARDLVNRPGNVVYPAVLAEEAKKIAQKTGLTCKVLEQKDMEKLGMGALLSVTIGSVQPPKLILLEYKGNAKSKQKTAFVGKGITFDSGGISLKPAEGMGEMKDDMGGAAAVLAAIQAIALLKLPVNIIAVIPSAENMPSGVASRPGDIIKAASGKTIEIISTDAEGRLILADAVWYAGEKLGAENIVDIATLTGAASVALGEFVAGVVANDQKLCDKVISASTESGERCWQMPAFEEYKEYNKSDVADIKNSGGRFGGMITGGLFIGEFTEKAWVHIDIGNTVSSKKDSGYNVKGATGFGVRLLVETARKLAL